jgi:ABC-type dipeptide/oligopeptide/nickel transport system permease component
MTAPSREEGIAHFREVLDIAADELFMVSIASPPPSIAVVRNDFMNVPRQAIRGNFLHTPLNLGSETFFFQRPTDSPGAIAQLKQDLLSVEPSPILAAAVTNAENDGGDRLGRLIRNGVVAMVLLAVVLIGLRHPYVGRRLLLFIPVILVISAASFTIIQLAPGNIIETRLLFLEQSGTPVDRQEIERITAQFHLDDHPVHRYLRWVGLVWFTTFDHEDRGLIQGDLGVSLSDPRRPQPVNELVLISLGTILFTWSLALPIGILSAVRQYSTIDYVLTFVGFIGMSIPGFLLALLIMYWGGRFLGLDLTGLFSPEYEAQPEWTWGKVGDLMRHIWVPLLVLGVQGTASMIRIMRGNLLDELRKPYVTTARAKGVRPVRLITKYPVRVALNPFISTIGNLFPELISGGAIVAVVLGLPTVGPMLLDALLSEDIYLAGSMLVVLSLLGIIGTLVSDLLLMALDPRIRMEGTAR